MANYLRQFLVGVLILFLGFCANHLKNIKASNYSNINYSKEFLLIDDLEIVTFNFYNQSDFAIDSMIIIPNLENMDDVRFDSELSIGDSNISKTDELKLWSGNFLKGDKIRCLLILNNDKQQETTINPELFVRAKRKDPENLKWIKVKLNEGTIPVNILLYKGFWLMLPFVGMGFVFLLFEYLKKKYWSVNESSVSIEAEGSENTGD